MVIVSNFVPKRRLVTNVTQALKALVTTSEAHGYESGQWVRLIVPLAYGMHLNYVATPIRVTSDTEFETAIDTTGQNPFSTPVFPPGFTQAHAVPITGVEDNIA